MMKNYLTRKRIRSLPFLTLLLFLFFNAVNAQNITLTWDKESGCQTYKPREKEFGEDIGEGACVRECETSHVKYTLNNSNSAWPAVWTVTGGTVTAANNTTCEVTWGDAGWGFVSVTVTTPNGPRTEQMCIEIIDGPKAEFMIYPGTDDAYTACINEVLYFTNLSAPDGGSQIVSYFWDFGDHTYSSEFEPNHFYAGSGPYTVILTVTNECNCSKSYKREIKVNDVKSFPITCNSVVCENGSDTYSIPDEIAQNCSDFKWIVEGGTITSQQPYGPSIDVTWDNVDSSGFGYVSFDGSNCGYDCSLVTIKVPVVLSKGKILGDTIVCSGEQYRYSLPQWPTTDFKWQIVANGTGASLMDTDQRNEIIVNTGSSGTITLRCTYQNTMLKCGGYAEIDIYVKAVGVITGPTAVCQNSSGTYTLNNGYIGDWTLKLPNNTTTTSTGNSYTIPFGIPGNYTLTVTGNDFCPPSNPFIIRVDAIPAAPNASDIVGPSVICPGSPVEYSMVNTVAGTVLKWQVTNGTISGSNYGESVTVEFTPGFSSYTIQVARENAAEPHCSSAFAVKTVLPHSVSLAITGPQSNICASSITNYAVAYTQGEAYEWSVSPASAGSVISNGNNAVAIQWNQVAGSAQVIVKVRKCNVWYTATRPVSLILGPAISVSNIPTSICPDVTFNPTITSVPALTGGTITWNFGDGTIITTNYNQPAPSHFYTNVNSATTYNVTVTVTNPNGCLAPAVQNLTVTVNPAPVALITPATNFVSCGPFAPVTLTATIQSGSAGTQSIQWYSAAGPIFGATGWSYTVNGYGEYRAWVQNSNGCGQFTNTVKFIENCVPGCTIVPNPTVSMTATQGGCNVISATASTSPAPVSYSWSVGPEATTLVSNVSTGVFSYDKAGNHTVIYYATYNGTTGPCTIMKVQNVIIPFIPKIKYKIACGSSGTYSVTLEDHSNYYPLVTPNSLAYIVDGNTYPVTVGTTSYTINLAPGNHTFGIKIGATGYSTCSDVTAPVNLPAFPVSGISGATTTCDGNGVTFTPSAGIIAGYTYLWNFGDGTTSISPQPTKVFASSGNKTVSLTVTNNLGCSSTSSIVVNVAQNLLSGNLTSTSPNCEDDPIIITYNNTGSAPSQYTWMKDNTVISTNTSNTLSVNESGSYWVSVTNSLGCIKKLDAVPAKFIMIPDPVIQGPSGVCVNEAFTLSGYAGGGSLQYRWLRDNVEVQTWSSSPILNYSMNTAMTSTFKVEVRVSDGAGSYCIGFATYQVTAYAKPGTPSLSFSVVNCDPYTITLTANAGVPGTYIWSNGMSGSTITVNSGGPYKVTFTNQGGCTSTAQFDVPKDPEVYLWIFPSGCYDFCFKRGDQSGPLNILGPSPFVQFSKWLWIKDGNVDQIGGGSVPNYTISTSGTYNLGLDNGYCYKQSDDMNVTVTDCKCEVKVEIKDIKTDEKPFCHYFVDMFIDNPYPVPIVVNISSTNNQGIFIPGAVTVPPGGSGFTLNFIPSGFTGGPLSITFTSIYKDEFCRTIVQKDFPYCGIISSRMAGDTDPVTGMSVKVNSLIAAPNPATDSTGLTYTFANEKAQVRTIEIYSLLGVLIDKHTPETQTGTWTVNLGRYASGQYIVVMREDGVTLAQKAIIIE